MLTTAICGACFVFALAFIILKKFAKLRAWAALIFSLGLAFGTFGGWAPAAIRWTFGWVNLFEGKLFVFLLGVAIPGLVALFLGIFFAHDVWPKHPGKMRATLIGFVLPFFLAAAGVSVGTLTSGMHFPAAAPSAAAPAVHVVTSGNGR